MFFEGKEKWFFRIIFKKKKLNIIYIFENIFHEMVKIHRKRNNCFQMKVS